MRDLTELKIIYPKFVIKCDILGEHPPMSTIYYHGYVKTMLVTSISYPSSSEPSHNQYNLNYFPNSNCNYSNNFISNIEQLNFNTNYQHCNVINNYQNCKNITSPIHDYNCSPSTSNYISTANHDTNEYFSFVTPDSSTESYYDNNVITYNMDSLDSNKDYYEML